MVLPADMIPEPPSSLAPLLFKPEPISKFIRPDAPVEAPVYNRKVPESPELEVPVLNCSIPLAPAAPAFTVRTCNIPLDVAVPSAIDNDI